MGKAIGYFPKFVVRLHNSKVKESFQLQDYALPLPLKAQHLEQAVYLVKRKTDMEDRRFKQVAKAIRLLLTD